MKTRRAINSSWTPEQTRRRSPLTSRHCPRWVGIAGLFARNTHQLADVPPETEWFANIDDANTRRAYRNDLKEFMTFAGIRSPTELRLIAMNLT